MFLYVSGGNVCCWVFHVALRIVGSFRRQCVVLYVLGGNVCCWVFYVTWCVVRSLGGNVCCWVF